MILNNMDEPHLHYAAHKKPGIQEYIWSDSIYVKYKNKQN